MKQFTITLTTLIILFTTLFLKAQDSTECEEGWNWHWEWDEVDEWTGWWSKKPTISLNYGFSDVSRKDVEAPFADNNLIELKLGYTNKKITKYADFIERRIFNYFLLNYNSTNLAGGSGTSSDIETKNWQFGFAWSTGYGYKVGEESSITPYYTSKMIWANINFLLVNFQIY